jgi:hypothetical protein
MAMNWIKSCAVPGYSDLMLTLLFPDQFAVTQMVKRLPALTELGIIFPSALATERHR